MDWLSEPTTTDFQLFDVQEWRFNKSIPRAIDRPTKSVS